MSNYALLDNVSHKDIKIVTEYSAKYGNNVGSVLTFPTEFSDIQKEYPILFQKDPETNKFSAIALLGFKKDENLYLNNGGWNASYIPAMVTREPFLIGYQNQTNLNIQDNNAMIHINMDSPRISDSSGTPIFLELGGNSPYLNKISHTLKVIHEGVALSDKMFDAFTHFDLIEPVKLDIHLNNGQEYSITGNYTINKEKLQSLSGSELKELNQTGFLQGAFLVISSMDNIYKLINIKNTMIS